MPVTNATMFQLAKQTMRIHPDWAMARVGEYAGIPEQVQEKIIGEARRELVTTEGMDPFGE